MALFFSKRVLEGDVNATFRHECSCHTRPTRILNNEIRNFVAGSLERGVKARSREELKHQVRTTPYPLKLAQRRYSTGIHKMCSYVAVVFVSMLAVVSGQCTKSFSGLTQCAILNGATTKDTGMISLIGYCLHSTHCMPDLEPDPF